MTVSNASTKARGPKKAAPKKTATPKASKGAVAHAHSDRRPLLPPAFLVFFKSTSWRLMGIGLLVVGIGIWAALLSHNPLDPSVNNISDAPTTNILGAVGANAADILMQTLALTAYLLPLPLILWGYKLLRLRWLPKFWLHLGFVPLSLVLLSVAFGIIDPVPDYHNQSGYGGSLGQILYQKVFALTAFINIHKYVYLTVFFILGIPAYGFSFALSLTEWVKIKDTIISGIRYVLTLVLQALRAVMTGFAYGAQNLYYLLRPVRERIEPSFGGREADTDQIDTAKPKGSVEAIVKPKEKRVKAKAKPERGGREAIEAQRTMDFGDGKTYTFPPLDLLSPPPPPKEIDRMSAQALEANARMLESVLDDFGVKGDIRDVRPGPVVTLYELEPARGVKSARVIGLADDIARSMSAISARVAVVPGRNAIGIELPNQKRETVFLRELLASRDYEGTKARLPVTLGKDIGGAAVVADLASMPHLLVAGTTGSGKSVGVNTMIMSLLYRHTPDTLRFIMVDPKMLELSVYDGIPHLLTPVVTEPKKAVVALKWAVREMEDRYRNMSRLGVRNLAAFNKRIVEARANNEDLTRQVQTGFDSETGQPIMEEQYFDFQPLPFIVIVIDEMADLMLVAGKDVEATVQRLAQMARAAGIHLVMATQRPSVDVITGTIKANFPTRMSFQVTSKIDSRTILGEQGAEQLLGMGDMLHMAGGGRITRVHGAFVSDDEVEDIVGHLKKQGSPEYVSSVVEEPEEGFDSPFIPGPSGEDAANSLYDKAVAIVINDRRASTSYIQRRLKIGYNKAATLIEDMEQQGVISGPNHKGQREILVPNREEEQ